MTAANILVVDDDPTVIAFIASTLEDSGHVSSAAASSEALRVLRRHVPDLILLSLDLQEPSGFELCAELKSIETVAHVPIIFLTTRRKNNHRLPRSTLLQLFQNRKAISPWQH